MRSLKEIDTKVELIETDLWKGKDQDNPSVVTRLLVLERDMNDLLFQRKRLVGNCNWRPSEGDVKKQEGRNHE